MVPGARVLVASLTSADQTQFLLGDFQRISGLQYVNAAAHKLCDTIDTVQFNNAVDVAVELRYC